MQWYDVLFKIKSPAYQQKVFSVVVADKTQMGPVCAKYGGINIKSPISKKGHKNEILTTNIRHRHFLMSVKVRSPYWDTKMNFIRCHAL